MVVTIIVVDEAEGRVVDLGGETEGVFGEEVAIGNAGGAGGAGDGAEGGVVIVRGDAVLRGVVEDLGDVLVAVVQEEGRALAVLSEAEGARGEGLRGIPNELLVDVPRAVGKELLDAEVAIV